MGFKRKTSLLASALMLSANFLMPVSTFAAGAGTGGLSFYDYLSTQADKDTVIDFNQAPATGDETVENLFGDIIPVSDIGGLYMLQSTKDNEKPMYFYRGNVEDNNVIFNDMCWLIVRTTETGGTKLIYNGKPDDDGVCVGGTDDGGFMDHQEAYMNSTSDASILPNTLIATSYFNELSKSPADMGYMYGERIEAEHLYLEQNTQYYFGNDVAYEGGEYSLTEPVPLKRDSNFQLNSEQKQNVEKGHHYTCFMTGTSCETVYYVSDLDDASNVYSIPITGGDNINDALAKMAENKNDSLAKQTLDDWYVHNMTSVTELLEDTIWYAGKSFGSGVLSSKDADTTNSYDDANISFTQPFIDTFYNGVSRDGSMMLPMIRGANGVTTLGIDEFRFGITNNKQEFGTDAQIDYLVKEDANAVPSFDYPEAENRFTVSEENGNGLLKYPVGMLTTSEMLMAGNGFPGHARGTYLDDDEIWWGITPIGFNFYLGFAGASAYYALAGYSYDGAGVNFLNAGVRPSVSLKSSLSALEGDGSKENPFQNFVEVAESDKGAPAEDGSTPANPQTSDAVFKAAIIAAAIGIIPTFILRKQLNKRAN